MIEEAVCFMLKEVMPSWPCHEFRAFLVISARFNHGCFLAALRLIPEPVASNMRARSRHNHYFAKTAHFALVQHSLEIMVLAASIHLYYNYNYRDIDSKLVDNTYLRHLTVHGTIYICKYVMLSNQA